MYVTDSGVLAKRTTVYRSADKGLGPTIHHDPRLSICHFRFGWRALRINYRHSSLLLAIAISPPESLSTFRNRRRNSTIPPPLLLFDRAFFFFLSNIRSLLSNDLIIRREQSSSFSKYFCSLIRATVQYATIDVNHDCVYCPPHKRRDKIFLYTNVPREYIYNLLCNFTFFL